MTVQPIAAGQALAQPATREAGVAARSRIEYVDNLRILLTTLVVLHHLSIGYGAPGGWYYHEGGPLNLVSGILMALYVAIDQSFFMGFFFMISSYFCPRSYDNKGAGLFLVDRIKRLGIPLVVFALVVQPILIYIVRLSEGYTGSFWGFLLDGLRGGGYGPGPLWFIVALLIFNVGYLVWRRATASQSFASFKDIPAPGNKAIALFAVALGLVSFVVRIWAPVGKTWELLGIDLGLQFAHFPQYIALFVVGLIAYRQNWFEKLPDDQARLWRWIIPVLVPAFCAIAILGGALEGGTEIFEGGLHWQSLAYALWEQFMGMAMIVTLLVWFRKHANRQGTLARTMSGATYATYIVHAIVNVLLALALSGIQADMSLKFVLAAPVAVSLAFLAGSGLRKLPFARDIL